jgi:DNA processing protein
MLQIKKLTLKSRQFPESLRELSSPPKELFITGESLEKLLNKPAVAIVGSRKVSHYGREVTAQLARELAERGIIVVSGLALGVDSIAHKACLDVGGQTIAVLPGPIEKIYPASHHNLAMQIVKQGGSLVSEYPVGSQIYKQNFIARNRLIAGLAQAVLITEAAEKSGSLHTARFALEQGKDVLSVPGNISSPTSIGANNLLKAGATPVTSYLDVLHALGLEEKEVKVSQLKGSNEHEQKLLDLLSQGINDGEDLLKQSQLPVSLFSQTLTMLEISGKVRSLGANQWSLR